MMRQSRFKNIVIIGQGKIANDICNYLLGYDTSYNYNLESIVYEKHTENPLYLLSKKNSIVCFRVYKKDELKDLLMKRYIDRTLIISAYNNYFFPKEVVENPLFTIINYHNSYLPRHQGGNAITWSIYNGEEYTGSTWHYVTCKLDAGDIIWQEKFRIRDDIKAYEVSKMSMQCAFEGFKSFFKDLLIEPIKGKKQDLVNGRRDFHLFSELPQNGLIFLEDAPKQIYRLLRAMDYGKTNDWPKPKLVLNDNENYEVKAYRIVEMLEEKERILDMDNKYVYFRLDNNQYLRIRIEKLTI